MSEVTPPHPPLFRRGVGERKSLTILVAVDPGTLVLPQDLGRRRADHVAEDQGVVALVELLPARRVAEGDPLCGGAARGGITLISL